MSCFAEAKQALRTFIAHIQATIADPEKVQGRLNKEDKVQCRALIRRTDLFAINFRTAFLIPCGDMFFAHTALCGKASPAKEVETTLSSACNGEQISV